MLNNYLDNAERRKKVSFEIKETLYGLKQALKHGMNVLTITSKGMIMINVLMNMHT